MCYLDDVGERYEQAVWGSGIRDQGSGIGIQLSGFNYRELAGAHHEQKLPTMDEACGWVGLCGGAGGLWRGYGGGFQSARQ